MGLLFIKSCVCIALYGFVFAAIANNIVNAVEMSHQTILIMSRDYVKSGWTRYEYQLAQREMLNGHHKIIPVFIEDPADIQIEDKNLRHMLKSVTYIVWSADGSAKKVRGFWEKLRKSLLQTMGDRDANIKAEIETTNL